MDEKKRVAGKTNLTDFWFEQLQDSEMEEGQGYEEKKEFCLSQVEDAITRGHYYRCGFGSLTQYLKLSKIH